MPIDVTSNNRIVESELKFVIFGIINDSLNFILTIPSSSWTRFLLGCKIKYLNFNFFDYNYWLRYYKSYYIFTDSR